MRKITACLLFALILNLCSCDNANAKNNQYDLITYGKDGITFGTTKNKVLNQKGKPENDYTTFIYYSADETINEDIKINSVWYYFSYNDEKLEKISYRSYNYYKIDVTEKYEILESYLGKQYNDPIWREDNVIQWTVENDIICQLSIDKDNIVITYFTEEDALRKRSEKTDKEDTDKLKSEIQKILEELNLSDIECYVSKMRDTGNYEIDFVVNESYKNTYGETCFKITKAMEEKIVKDDIPFRRMGIRLDIKKTAVQTWLTDDFNNGTLINWQGEDNQDLTLLELQNINKEAISEEPPKQATTEMVTEPSAITAESTQSIIEALNGYHVQEYDNGDKYSGNFVDGVRSGQGLYEWADGNKYDGEFVNGNPSGKGEYTYTTEAPTDPPPAKSENKPFVITYTGKKYHKPSCRTVKSIKQYVTKEEAWAMGYDSCGVCHPR